MPVLCLDTATETCVAALLDPPEGGAREVLLDGRAQELLPRLDDLCSGVERASIEAVVVGTGPGGFTGLRVGVTLARGIAETLGVPLLGVSSTLVVAARAAIDQPGARVWAVVDARRGEWFVQPFRCDPAGSTVTALDEVRAVAHADLDAVLAGEPHVDRPTAASLVAAARGVLAGHRGGDPAAVVPDYGRPPDAAPPRMDWRIGELVPADIDALVHLEQRCFATPWTRGMYAGEFDRSASDAVRLAARDGGSNDRLVGALVASRIGDCWHVMNVLVDPVARRRGIAAALVEAMFERVRELGVGEGWTLEVRDGNEAAIRLYEAHGFEHAGRRRGYYADSGEDALVMWRAAQATQAGEATR